MQLKSILKSALRRMLAKRGHVLMGNDDPRYRSSMQGVIHSLAERGQSFGTVIDVGAAIGSWSLLCMEHFPQSNYLLVEAQPIHRQALEEFALAHPRAQYVLAAASDTAGQIFFDASDPFSGQASHSAYQENNLQLPATTIDAEIQTRGLPAPYLLKLDTHGFEVPILHGARETLKRTDAIIMECYNFKIAPESLLFHEMCENMMSLGFRCVGMADPLHRAFDHTFWQVDLVFVPSSRPEFSCDGYEKPE